MKPKPNTDPKPESPSGLHAPTCSAFQLWWSDMDNGCPTLVLDNDEDFAVAVWNAAVERALLVLPGGQLCDPQEVADMLRELIEPNAERIHCDARAGKPRETLPPGDGGSCSRCIVYGCANHRHQGRFIGDLCAPCHSYITTGIIGPTTSFLGKLDGLTDALKTISMSDWKTAGELQKMARDAYSSANTDVLARGDNATPTNPKYQ